ncbi:MAG: hypothetical protein NVSMB42_17880 [Herpetosiphon sp.]
MAQSDETLPLSRPQLAALARLHNLPDPATVRSLGPSSIVVDESTILYTSTSPGLLQKQAAIYQHLRASGLAAPTVLALDHTRDLVSADLLLVAYIPGKVAANLWADLDEQQRERLSTDLGRYIAVVHQSTWPGYGDYNAVSGTFDRHPTWSEALAERILSIYPVLLDDAVVACELLDGAVIRLNDAGSLIETASRPALIHANLDWRNVVLTPGPDGWSIAALLNWDAAVTADLAWEWSNCYIYPNRLYPVYDAFQSGYRSVSPLPPDLSTRRTLYRLLIHLEGALDAVRRNNPRRRSFHEAALSRLLSAA